MSSFNIPTEFDAETFRINGDGNQSGYIGDNQYLDSKLHLAITKQHYDLCINKKGDQSRPTLTKLDATIIFLDQYIYLREQGNEIPQAGMIAAVRLQLLKFGLLFDGDVKSVHTDEIAIVKPKTQSDYDKATKEFFSNEGNKIFHQGQSYAILCAVMSSIVFKKTGHHYTPEQDQLYEKMEKATYGQRTIPMNRHILYRVTVHPFGVAALSSFTDWYMSGSFEDDKKEIIPVANSLQVRWECMPSGMSGVGVGIQVLEMMEHHSWYSSFYCLHQKAIDLIRTSHVEIQRNWRPYHNNASLYGFHKAAVDDIKASMKTLAPYFVGFLQAFDAKMTLMNNQALKYMSQENVYVVNMFRVLVSNDLKHGLQQINIEKYFDQLLMKQLGAKEIMPEIKALMTRIAKDATSTYTNNVKKVKINVIKKESKIDLVQYENVEEIVKTALPTLEEKKLKEMQQQSKGRPATVIKSAKPSLKKARATSQIDSRQYASADDKEFFDV